MNTLPSIDVFPRHTLRDLFAPSGAMKSILASYDRLCLFGRDALYWGLKCLDPNPRDCIWVPSFHCGVEVQAALDAGFSVKFYRILPDLSIDEEYLKRNLAQCPGHVLIIHYFGFAQAGLRDLVSLCNHYGVALVEDCSHALFSKIDGQPLGQFGHIAAYSLYKTMGLCDGGALLLNRTRWQGIKGRPSVTPTTVHPSFHGYLIQLRALVKKILGPKISRWYQGIRKADKKYSSYASPNMESLTMHPLIIRPHDYRRGMSLLSQRLASTMDPLLIVRKRRENWQYLESRLSHIHGFQLVFHKLQEGICPLFMPIWVSRQEILRSKLNEQKIETFVFGRFAHPQMNKANFPEAEVLRSQILCLPIHQYMTEIQLSHIVGALGPLLQGETSRAQG